MTTPSIVRAAIYARVSTQHQEDEGTSLDTQIVSCRRHAAEQGYTVVEDHVYREVYTGVELWDRPRLTQLREAVRRGEVTVVVCHAIDRLSRDPVHLGVILTEADHQGATVDFVSEPLDHSPEGQLIRFVRGYAAKVEHEKIRERTMRGTRERVRSGRPLAGARAPYGYRWRDESKSGYEVEPLAAQVVRRIFDSVVAGSTLRALAIALAAEGLSTPTGRGHWQHTTLRAIMTNPVYAGRPTVFRTVRAKVNGRGRKLVRPRPEDEWVELPAGVAPVLVSESTFETAQQRLILNRRRSAGSNRTPELTLLRGGFVRCGYCGHSMIVRRGKVIRYRCGRSLQANAGPGHSHAIAVAEIDGIAWERAEALLLRPEIIATELERLRKDDPTEADLAAIERALSEVGRKQANLVDQLADLGGSVAVMVRERLALLDRERERLAAERSTILDRQRGWRATRERVAGLERWCRQVAANLSDMDYQRRRLVFEALGLQVRVWRSDHPEQRWEIVTAIDSGVITDNTAGSSSSPPAARSRTPRRPPASHQ